MLGWRTCTFVNARVITADGEASSIRFRRRIVGLDESPHAGDSVVDLDGRIVLPGLINAHDHLELNHYGPLKVRDRYDNAREWIDDLTPLIRTDAIRQKSRAPLADRLFIGGLKNLLSGVTTVAHHNPVYRAFGLHFPVRVLEKFGWAHSVSMEQRPVGAHGEPGGSVGATSAATPHDRPFIVHAAEGIDAEATLEEEALNEVDALRSNTLLVHGLGISPERWHALFERGVSLVWCPRSNTFLFGRTLNMPAVLTSPASRGRVCLATDSRLTGSQDLLDELRCGLESGVTADDLLRMVTSSAASALRLDDGGTIAVGQPADLLVIPPKDASPSAALLRCSRAELSLVVRRGTPLVGEPGMAAAFDARCVHVRDLMVDGARRLAQAALVRRIERCTIQEPGVAPEPCTRPQRGWIGRAVSS